jgi:hypothetical protein
MLADAWRSLLSGQSSPAMAVRGRGPRRASAVMRRRCRFPTRTAWPRRRNCQQPKRFKVHVVSVIARPLAPCGESVLLVCFRGKERASVLSLNGYIGPRSRRRPLIGVPAAGAGIGPGAGSTTAARGTRCLRLAEQHQVRVRLEVNSLPVGAAVPVDPEEGGHGGLCRFAVHVGQIGGEMSSSAVFVTKSVLLPRTGLRPPQVQGVTKCPNVLLARKLG